MEVQQSSLYATYVSQLGWTVEQIDRSYIFIKRFPLIGTLAKIQRVDKLPLIPKLLPIIHKYHIRTLSIEPDRDVRQSEFQAWDLSIKRYVRLSSSYFLPTKTILVDLTPSEKIIFQRFSEAKRRAVRRAQKNHIVVKESRDINLIIRTKNASSGFLGFITTYGIKKLWSAFSPDYCTGLLAYEESKTDIPLGCILLLFWNKTAYYWIVGASPKGKKLFVPTLLVWEALKISKKYGCKQFDFVGVWDERLPKKNLTWTGFTKFKEGFGGSPVYYPLRG